MQVGLLALGAGVVLAYMAARLPLARMQELRIALTARDMVEQGHWLRPTFRGQPRYQKPPLMYWLTGAAYLCAGTTQSPLAARAAGIAFSVGLIALVYIAGREWVGRRAAAAAAAMLATSYGFVRFGFRIEADMAQAFWILLSMWYAWRAWTKGHAPLWGWAAGAAAGLGTLTKSPAPLFTLAAVLLFGHRKRRTQEPTAWPSRVGALVLAVALALAWYVPVGLNGSSRMAAQAAMSSELSVMWDRPTHPGPIGYYSYTTLVATLPWSPAVVLGLVRTVRRARSHTADRWLLVWLAATVFLLSAAANKQIHYCSLLLAPTLLMAGAWTTHPSAVAANRIRFTYGLALDVALVCVGLALATSPAWTRYVSELTVPTWVVGAGLATGLCGLVGIFRAHRTTSELPRSTFLLGVWTLLLVLAGPMAPWIEREQVIMNFARSAAPHLAHASNLAGVGDNLASLEFHLGRPIREFRTLEDAWAALSRGGWLVVSSLHGFTQAPQPTRPLCEVRIGKTRIALYQHN